MKKKKKLKKLWKVQRKCWRWRWRRKLEDLKEKEAEKLYEEDVQSKKIKTKREWKR